MNEEKPGCGYNRDDKQGADQEENNKCQLIITQFQTRINNKCGGIYEEIEKKSSRENYQEMNKRSNCWNADETVSVNIWYSWFSLFRTWIFSNYSCQECWAEDSGEQVDTRLVLPVVASDNTACDQERDKDGKGPDSGIGVKAYETKKSKHDEEECIVVAM